MKDDKEKVLSKIKLKYYKKPRESDKSIKSGITCAWCFETDVVNIGGGYRDDKGKIYQICERCAVHRYKQEHGYKTLTAAKNRRRRIFDIGYLFNELVLDVYMSSKNISNFESCKNADDVFIKAGELYNLLFTKEEKIRIEEMESQKEIEDEFQKRLLAVDLDKFFLYL